MLALRWSHLSTMLPWMQMVRRVSSDAKRTNAVADARYDLGPSPHYNHEQR